MAKRKLVTPTAHPQAPRARLFALSLLTLSALWLCAASPSAWAQGPHAALVGTWRFSGGASETQAVNAAIQAALADFNPVMREIVASQLRDSNRPYPQFSIAVDGDHIVTRANQRTMRTPSDGATRELTTPEGRSAQVSQVFRGGRLIQTLVNPQGTRTHTIAPASSDTLTLQVRIESSHLPRPIEYSLTYTRAP